MSCAVARNITVISSELTLPSPASPASPPPAAALPDETAQESSHQVVPVHCCPQCLELFRSEGSLICHRFLRNHYARFFHKCIWPGCTFRASHRYQIRLHVRRLHYHHRMPRTVREMFNSALALKICGKRVRHFSSPDDFIISSSGGDHIKSLL